MTKGHKKGGLLADALPPYGQPLTAETVKLVKPGDLLRVVNTTSGPKIGDVLSVIGFADSRHIQVLPNEDPEAAAWQEDRFSFIAPADPANPGWYLAPKGGFPENPVPGKWVDAAYLGSPRLWAGVQMEKSEDVTWVAVTRFRIVDEPVARSTMSRLTGTVDYAAAHVQGTEMYDPAEVLSAPRPTAEAGPGAGTPFADKFNLNRLYGKMADAPPTMFFDPILSRFSPSEHETIVAAAILIEGVTISLPQPARHGEVLIAASGFVKDSQMNRETQGFLTSTGRFVNRVQAFQLAWVAKQITEHPRGGGKPELFSEDLW